MAVNQFLNLLLAFSVISSLITEVIKQLIENKGSRCYNLIALCVSLVVGGCGTLIFYQLTGIPYTINNIIYAVLMGIASALVSMEGYDKVKQAIDQLINPYDKCSDENIDDKEE